MPVRVLCNIFTETVHHCSDPPGREKEKSHDGNAVLSGPGLPGDGPSPEVAAPGDRAEITLTMENTFQPAGRAFGMSLMEGTGGPDVFLAGVNNNAMKIYIYTPRGSHRFSFP